MCWSRRWKLTEDQEVQEVVPDEAETGAEGEPPLALQEEIEVIAAELKAAAQEG